MSAYTVTTTSAQDSLLTWLVNNYNSDHGTTLDIPGYVNMRLPELLKPYQQAYLDYVNQTLASKYASADPTVQSQVNTLLGIS